MSIINSYANGFISTERIIVDDIPCLKIKPKESREVLPTILYYHGWNSNKENQKFKASVIACSGYQVIVPDSIYHGERTPIQHNEPGMMDKYFWDVIINSVNESEKLIKYIVEYHGADPNRIGIMGHSMGGFISSGSFVVNKNIRCMVNYNGSCAWVKADEIFRNRDNKELATETELERLKKYDLFDKIDKIKLRPILIVHGDSDTSVPIDSQRMFYREVYPLYKEKEEMIRLIEYPRMDHYMSLGMLEEGIIWLNKYL